MAGPKQSPGQAAARGSGRGAGTKKSATRGGRPEAQPGASAARGKPGGKARPAGGAPPDPADPARGQRDKAGPARTPAAAAHDAAPRAAAPVLTAPLWLQLTTLALSLIGLGLSVYLTIAHYSSSVTLACSDKGIVNCAKVTSSAESKLFGFFPVAVLGLAFYVFMTAINTPWAWRARLPVIRWARLASVIIGIVFVLYLVYSEVITLGSICLFCTEVHIVTLLLFGLIVFSASAGYGVKPALDQRARQRR
jgi:uncharacterized membrane protein